MSQLGHSTAAELQELRRRNNFLRQEIALLTAERNRFQVELRVERGRANQLMAVIRGQIDDFDTYRGTLRAAAPVDTVERELSRESGIPDSPRQRGRSASIDLGGASSIAQNSSGTTESPRQRGRSASIELGGASSIAHSSSGTPESPL